MSDARQAEATDEKATVEFRGHTFTVDRNYNDWSVDLVESIEEGKSVGICRGALGPRQWLIVKTMSLNMRELDELGGEIAKALGFGGTGESAPSGD